MDDARIDPIGSDPDVAALLGAALARIEQLEARVAELEPGVVPDTTHPTAVPPVAVGAAPVAVPWPVAVAGAPTEPDDGDVGSSLKGMDRRRALQRAGVVAGAAVAAAVLGDARPAAAANGANMVCAAGNTASDSTSLRLTGSSTVGGFGFGVFDGTPGTSSSTTGAVVGHGKGTNFTAGVYGIGEGDADAVYGRASAGRGVYGESGSNPGVHGKSTSLYGVVGDSTNSEGVFGSSSGSTNAGVLGTNFSSSSACFGVRGVADAGQGVKGEATNGVGVHGSSPNNTGVWGESTASWGTSGVSVNNWGVYGESASTLYGGVLGNSTSNAASAIGVEGLVAAGKGVYGKTTTGTGVYGESTSTSSGWGMQAVSAGGNGLKAVGKVFGIVAQSFSTTATDAAVAASTLQATGISVTSDDGLIMSGRTDTGGGIQVDAPKFHLRLANAFATRNAPTADAFAHNAGEVVYTTAGETWVCVKGGTPGTWRKVAGQATAGSFHVLAAPARMYDSRPGTSPSQGPKAKLVSNAPITLDCTVNSSGVPKGATAVALTVLLVNAAAANGNFTVWANGVARPASNTMVWGPNGGRFTTSTISAVDANAKLQVVSSASTDLVLDIVGYYR